MATLPQPPGFTATPREASYEAVVVGSGPNGLAAAIELARAGVHVLVVEGAETIGGGMRTRELTLPGFAHDVCSAVHPMGLASPFLSSLPLARHGLEWMHADVPLAHPLDGGRAAVMARSLEETADGLGGKDGAAYRRTFGPLLRDGWKLMDALLGPLQVPRHPLAMAAFGLKALRSGSGFARGVFEGEAARALFAGNAAHAIQPLEKPLTAAIGIMLMLAGHLVGWPVARGGSQAIADAMARYLVDALGGEIVCRGRWVETLEELPRASVYLFDTSPRALVAIAGERLSESYRRAVGRYRYGPGVFKVDWALDGPIPWANAACRRACTVHVGGTLEEIAASERDCWNGRHSENPFVLAVQPSVFDPTRAPEDKHTGWAYAHAPAGSTRDQTAAVEGQIERFAPGFRDRILARHTMHCADFETYNPNYIGGDIICGVADWRQLFTRPVVQANPYRTPNRSIFLCSSATPPGGGVHGRCGFWAARSALKALGRKPQ